MRRRDDFEIDVVLPVSVSVFLLALVFLAGWWIASEKCERRWARSGMQAELHLFAGCLVQRKDGTWVPSSVVRELSP